MEVDIGELRSTLTLTDSGSPDAQAVRRLVQVVKELVLAELRREERRRSERLDSRRIDVERY